MVLLWQSTTRLLLKPAFFSLIRGRRRAWPSGSRSWVQVFLFEQLDLFHDSPVFMSSVTPANSDLVSLPPVGVKIRLSWLQLAESSTWSWRSLFEASYNQLTWWASSWDTTDATRFLFDSDDSLLLNNSAVSRYVISPQFSIAPAAKSGMAIISVKSNIVTINAKQTLRWRPKNLQNLYKSFKIKLIIKIK